MTNNKDFGDVDMSFLVKMQQMSKSLFEANMPPEDNPAFAQSSPPLPKGTCH